MTRVSFGKPDRHDRAARSPKRDVLCSRQNAIRVAGRLQDQSDGAVSVVRTTQPLQPYRVSADPDAREEVIAVVTC